MQTPMEPTGTAATLVNREEQGQSEHIYGNVSRTTGNSSLPLRRRDSGRGRYVPTSNNSSVRAGGAAQNYSRTGIEESSYGSVSGNAYVSVTTGKTCNNSSSLRLRRFNNKHLPSKQANRHGNDAATLASGQSTDCSSSVIRTVPLTHELAFYVAIESCPNVREHWDSLIKSFEDSTKTDQPNDSLCQHAQLLYNSTQGHLDRLAKVVEGVKEQKQRESQFFIPIYNFYKHEKSRFYEVLQTEVKERRCSVYDNVMVQSSPAFREYKIFSRFVKKEAMTELVLDASFNGRISHLPKCIFTVSNLERLSLCENNLRSLPADVGRLERLRILELSRNRLKNDSIPYTLIYCTEITTLHLDYNMLDAVPGFILELKNLKTLHRHGNQNYFRSTFMWYGCESRERIRTASFSDVDVAAVALNCATHVQPLMFWSARTIISSKANYFMLPGISETMKDYISDVYSMFNICAACQTANLLHSQGYFVFTFHNPFVGNTCVPFQHWSCSRECALSIEIPARRQQIRMARQQQKLYDSHVRLYSRQPDTIHEHTMPVLSNNNMEAFQRCQPSSREYRSKRRRCRIM